MAWWQVWAVLVFGCVQATARGQESAVQEGSQGEVAIARDWVGAGGVVRPGEWAGIQLRINDSNDKPREVVIRIPTVDPDGDKPLWEGTLTTNPGVNQPVWAYLRLPATFKTNDPIRAFVYAAVEGPPLAPGLPPSVTAGRQLGSTVFMAQRVLTTSEGMLGIVGNRKMGLGRYAGSGNHTSLPSAHERWEVIDRLDPETLPDRWMGLMQFEALVWNDPPPSALGTEKSQAIREWVTRGGHLVIVLPRLAQTWTDEANNPLFDLVPRVGVRRREGVDLEPLRQLVTYQLKEAADARNSLDMPANEVLQTFVPLQGATSREAMCIIAMPKPAESGETEWLVGRRQVGLGLVTVIGLDAGSRWMDARALPDPELFWHRILGRRGQMLAPKPSGDITSNYALSRAPATVDNSIADQISKQTLAGAGVLLGLVVFVVYWLIAGPLGYAALKKTGRQRHAWVGFVLAAGLFTGVAWGGAAVIRPAKTSASHLTILDHVYTPEGQSVQRARSWMSVLIPQYGEAALAIGDPSQPGTRRFHNLLSPWEHERQSSAGFPDARSYRINSRAPEAFTIPARSTVKQFQVDWAGGPIWKMPRPAADASGKLMEITAEPVERGGVVQSVALTGSLVHDLPGPIHEMLVVVNLGQRPLSRSFSNLGAWRMTSDVFVAKLTKDWDPGTPLDLAQVLKTTTFSPGDKATQGTNPSGYFGTLLSELAKDTDQVGGAAGSTNLNVLVTKMYAMTFMGQIEPPSPESSSSGYQGKPLARRQATHGFDLSAWMTQPCIIIVGYVGGRTGEVGPSPVPLSYSTGGAYRTVPTDGCTFIRWVYPLPTKPPTYGTSSDAVDSKGPPEPSPEDPT